MTPVQPLGDQIPRPEDSQAPSAEPPVTASRSVASREPQLITVRLKASRPRRAGTSATAAGESRSDNCPPGGNNNPGG